MQSVVDELVNWSTSNHMNINSRNTKEMILGSMRKQTVSPVMISQETIEQLTSFKRFGVTVSDSLRWGDHVAAVTAVTAKASKRLRFLKKLKRAGVTQSDLVYCYEAVIRPVMEYTGRGWHSSLTSEQSKTIETVQRRACQIIIGGGTYSSNCSSLKQWTAFILDVNSKPKKLFNQVVNKPEHCLHYLLPTARKQSVTDRLRPANKLPRIFAKTNRFKNSCICYSLNSLRCE